MERAKIERRKIRGLFTRCANKLEEALNPEAPTQSDSIGSFYDSLVQKRQKLVELDNQIFSMWLDIPELNEDEWDRDLETTEDYNERWFSLDRKYKDATKREYTLVNTEENGSTSTRSDTDKLSRLLKLPKLELPKFNGDLKTWIHFWGMFEKIHNDTKMDDDIKFQYLAQCLEPESPPHKLVSTYPPTAANYPSAVSQLKERFGRDDLLIEMYIRELLRLILEQNKSGTIPIATLYDKLKSQLNALDSLGVTSDRYAAMLRPLVESALPVDLLRVWERTNKERKDGSDLLKNLLDFIKLEAESEERIMLSHPRSIPDEPSTSCLTTSVKETMSPVNDKRKCIFCDKVTVHVSSECNKAMKMSLQERRDIVKKSQACFICLVPMHSANRCRSYPKCLICSKRHVTLLCRNFDKKDEPKDKNPKPKSNDDDKQLVALYQSSFTTTVILPTLVLDVVHKDKSVKVRALLDSGAQRSFIKAKVAKELNLKPCGEAQISHNLFGGVVTKKEVHKAYQVRVKSNDCKYETKIEVLEQDTICKDLPKANGDVIEALQKKGIHLSDNMKETGEVSLLIGADFLGALMTGKVITLKDNLIAIETHFGWSVQGPTASVESVNINVNTFSFDVEDLWKLETVGINDNANTHKANDKEISTFFNSTIRVNEESRYEVKLPWKDAVNLPTNYNLALKRLKSNTKRLTQLGILKDYDQQFQEWKDNSIIEVVNEADPEKGHYLPHHAVVKEASLTTKIRPVFDASACQSKDAFSLNENLEKGANMISLIPQLFVKFRKGAIGVVSDIKKAFLQISLYPEDRDYLKFLWWRNIDENPKQLITYRHNRVVFGVITSPYLLMATIYFHLDKYTSETAAVMKESFYCDNCVTSVDNTESLKRFETEAKNIMLQGQFELRCWVSGPVMIDESVKETSVLGLNWDPHNDQLYCKVPEMKVKEITKRVLLSIAQSIFDPIGFVSPCTIIPKMLIQKCWKLELDWDTKLPLELEKEANDWIQHIHCLSECKIPRHMSHTNINDCERTLHTFSDASAAAFSSCVFLRTESEDGKISVQLLMAKSRVTPAKTITMPRLELTAAVLATRLANTTKKALDLTLTAEYYWTDSAIVLAWIQKGSNLNIFVHNRIKEIKENTNSDDWRHVPGNINPADLPSRGCTAKMLLKSRWWEGPHWLKKHAAEWPNVEVKPDIEEVNKEAKITCLAVQTDNDKFSSRLTYFSKHTKTVRTLAWCIRFIENCRNKTTKKPKITGDIKAEDYEKAERQLFKIIQKEEFTDLQSLKKRLNMEIIEDKDKLLRVQTRLTLREDTESFIFPILLPGKNSLIESFVCQCHVQLCHAGSLTLISKLRENVWIIGIRLLSKKIVRNCVICRRFSAKKCTTAPAPLPTDRTACGDVFQVTGIDLAGPIQLRSKEKFWIVLFTCATYRAIHLELCRGLSTEEFILAFRRFIARRRRPSTVYTDNGTNFRGTERLLRTIDWAKIENETSVMKIKWQFSPPSAPWWGGFWERLVKTVKESLRRILGKASVDAVTLETVLCEVESIVNSRPLSGLSGETDDVAALTPDMFLSGPKMQGTPDLDHVDLHASNKRVVNLRDQLKRRFRSEYLSLLKQSAISGNTSTIEVGDVVLVETQNKRVMWPLARVLEIYEGPDGHKRVAKIKTAHGELVRPLQRLYSLELPRPAGAPAAGGGC